MKVFGILASLFILAVVTGILVQILGGEAPLEGVVFFFVWLALVLAVIAYQAFRGITSITLERETITFRSPLRTISVPVSSIISVETAWFDINRFAPYFRHQGGRIQLMGPFDGFYDLLNRLKAMNPSIEIKRL